MRQHNLFPNTFFSFTPKHLCILRPRPHPDDSNRCWFHKVSLALHAHPSLSGGVEALPALHNEIDRLMTG